MNLLTIGQTYVNLDQVATIRDLSTAGPGGQPQPGPVRVEFSGGHAAEFVQQAAAIRSWLAANVTASTAAT